MDVKTAWRPVLCLVGVAGLGVSMIGCHGEGHSGNGAMLDGWAHSKGPAGQLVPGQLAKAGSAEIRDACSKEPFANARKGLIVAETRLREDVFELRDRVSLAAVPYGLDETIRIEGLLRADAIGAQHSEEQEDCLRGFAAHLATLTDPMVEEDRIQKELDLSAFDSATKEAEEQLERRPVDTTQSVSNRRN